MPKISTPRRYWMWAPSTAPTKRSAHEPLPGSARALVLMADQPSTSEPQWHLYLLRLANGHLYTGITTDVERRFAEHVAGPPKGAKSLRGKGPLTLEFQAPAGDRSRASKLEWQVKRWPRGRKEALLKGEISLPDDA